MNLAYCLRIISIVLALAKHSAHIISPYLNIRLGSYFGLLFIYFSTGAIVDTDLRSPSLYAQQKLYISQ